MGLLGYELPKLNPSMLAPLHVHILRIKHGVVGYLCRRQSS